MSKDQRAYTIDPARVVTGDEGHKDWSSSDHGATTLLVSDNSRARVGYPKEFGLSTINDDRSIDHNNNTNIITISYSLFFIAIIIIIICFCYLLFVITIYH